MSGGLILRTPHILLKEKGYEVEGLSFVLFEARED